MNGFIPFFIPWFEEPTAVMKTYQPLGELDAEEAELRDVYQVSDEQLAWRRYIGISVLCHDDLDLFHQEYPAYPEQAFLSSGRPFFDQVAVRGYLDSSHEAVWQGYLLEHEGRISPRPQKNGPLSVWRMPEPDEDYLISADCAEGTDEGDAQSVHVFTRSALEVVAAWHGRIPRDELGDVLYCLGRVFNDAQIAVELNGGWGETPVAILRRRGYPRLYRRRDENTKQSKSVKKVGWMTTPASRVLALDALSQAMRDGDLVAYDKGLFDECLTFIISDSGKPEASLGRHDDRVMSAAIGVYLWLTTAKASRTRTVEPPIVPDLHPITGYPLPSRIPAAAGR